MNGKSQVALSQRWREGRGVTLIETLMAAAILMIVVAGLVPLFTTALLQNEQQGDVATRTTEYAQDKMEQLMKLDFNDGTTDTTVFPTNPTGCTGTAPNICGLGGTMGASATAGAIPPAASVAGYVDYLDTNGILLPNATGKAYTRQWMITTDPTVMVNSSTTLKGITVTVTSVPIAGSRSAPPSTTVVCYKSSGL